MKEIVLDLKFWKKISLKISAFFAKLIVRKVKNPSYYKEDEVEKIYKFFKGYYLLKYYQFWEKIFAIYIVYEEYILLQKTINEIRNEIFSCNTISNNSEFQKSMLSYLKNCVNQVLVLKPEGSIIIDIGVYNNKYLRTLRSHYTFFPWMQYTPAAQKGKLDLTDRFVYSKHKWVIGDLDIDPKIIPYRVKFYYAYMQEFYKQLYYQEV